MNTAAAPLEIQQDLAPPEPVPAEQDHYHARSTRVWHWVNLVALIALFMSGLMIFNAHPSLYWGEAGNRTEPGWLMIGARGETGFVRVGSVQITSTGVLGRWEDADGISRNRAFPYWATIPSDYNLADARHWHFFFAWIFAFGLLAFMVVSLFNGHLMREIAMRSHEWRPSTLWQTIVDHARLRFHTETGESYNPLQKLSYIAIIFVALPLMIVTGLAMSPAVDAALHFPSIMFGGRQSARSIHFIIAFALVAFLVVHVALVLIHKPLTLLRGMTIGARR